jgi:hypothetical protein
MMKWTTSYTNLCIFQTLGLSTDSKTTDAGVTSASDMPKLTKEQIGRYSRQLILPELGVKG